MIFNDKNASRLKNTLKMCVQNLSLQKYELHAKRDKGIYRNLRKKLTPEQKALKKQHFDPYNYQYMVTIKLPAFSYSGYKRSKAVETARKDYRKIILYFQKALGGNNWERHPLHIVGALENGTDETLGNNNAGYFHVHFLILKTRYSDKQIIKAFEDVDDKFGFPGNVIVVDELYKEKGAILYLLKEQGYKTGSHEYCEIFNTESLFKIPMPKIKRKKDKKWTLEQCISFIASIKRKFIKYTLFIVKELVYNSFYGIYT